MAVLEIESSVGTPALFVPIPISTELRRGLGVGMNLRASED